MSLSKSDRERLAEILDENRKTAAQINPFIDEDNEVVDKVRDAVDALRQNGRDSFRSHELVDEVGRSSTVIGHALNILYSEGEVGREGGQSPYLWRVNP